MSPRTAAISASAARADGWRQLADIPDPPGVAAPFAGVSGGALLVAGGANFRSGFPWQGRKKAWHERVWGLDAPDAIWREAGKLPRPLGGGVSVTCGDGRIRGGGSDHERHFADAFQPPLKPRRPYRF